MEQDFETFCWQLASVIRDSGLTRAELADRLGLKPATIKSWCVGRRSPTVRRLLELTSLLEVEPSALFVPAPSEPVRHECAACGQVFQRPVGYRIHVALRSKDDPAHARLGVL